MTNENIETVAGGKTNIILDATLLASLMKCPRFTDFRFNHNLIPIGGKSNSLECGSIVHMFAESYYGNIIKGIKRDDALGFALASAELYIQGCPHCTNFTPTHIHLVNDEKCTHECVVKPSCGHQVNQFPGTPNTPREPDKSNPADRYKTGWAWVLETCKQYHEYYRNDHWVPLEVEVVKGEILYEDDEVRILWKAKLDLVCDTNQGIFPIDHKTMKQNRVTSTMNNQFIGQCIMMKTRQVFINKIGFQTTLKPEEKFIRHVVSYTPERLIEWQSEILPYYAKLLLMYTESGYFPPNFNSCEGKYGNCEFETDVCTNNPAMRNEELKLHFMVGPDWNPINVTDGRDE